MFIAIIFVGFLLFTFLKILFGNGASAWKQLKWKGKLFTVIGIVWAIGFMCFGVWQKWKIHPITQIVQVGKKMQMMQDTIIKMVNGTIKDTNYDIQKATGYPKKQQTKRV